MRLSEEAEERFREASKIAKSPRAFLALVAKFREGGTPLSTLEEAQETLRQAEDEVVNRKRDVGAAQEMLAQAEADLNKALYAVVAAQEKRARGGRKKKGETQ